MNFQSLRVSTKLSIGFGLVLSLLSLMAGLAIWQMARLAGTTDFYAVNIVPSFQVQHDISVALATMRRSEFRHLLSDSEAEMQDAEKRIEASRKLIDEKLALYAKDLVTDEEDKRGLDRARAAIQAYQAEWERVRPISRRTATDPAAAAEAKTIVAGEGFKTFGAAEAAMSQWWDYNIRLGRTQDRLSDETYGRAKFLMLSLTLLALGGGAAAAVLIVRSLTRQLGGEPAEAAALASAIAEGDLTRRITVKPGDTGSLMARLAAMQDGLQRVVASVRQNSESVATASAQIAQGNQDLSGRTEEQASALQQTAATMEQLGTTVRTNADSAKHANQLAQGATAVAGQGGEVVGRVVDTMQAINDSSRRIGDIISVIDGIAFQTNILALNAAVEAARAGEQGRGFAVVASEVRSLAQRSAEAAKEIKTLIGRSVEQVEQGTQLVDQAGKTMGEIVASIQRVTDIVAQISASSVEQSSGVTQVGEAVSQMDQATQQNAALVEESAAAAESLKAQARQLVDAVAVFKLAQGHSVA